MHDVFLLQCTPDADTGLPDWERFLTRRFNAADLPHRLSRTALVDPLAARSVDTVYLVPAASLDDAAWPALRTRLAASNRYFIIVGEDLPSLEIVRACRDGAFDVLNRADPPPRWAEAIRAAARAQALWWQLYGAQGGSEDSGQIIGRTPAIKALRLAIDRLGPTRASILVLGESGTGKERVASALHEADGKGEFVAFNCAALPADLLEAELFGVNKGAFTGAHTDRPGLVEQADGGTLFLDEIGEMAPTVQAKLLRFLETRTARRLGSNQVYQVDLRIVAATNRDLEQAKADGTFRPDLFYRLAEITLELVPLRERADDIPLLARHFMSLAGEHFGKFFDSIEPDLVLKLQAHPWPGNVRELKNTIDRLVLLHDGPVLRAGWWDPPIPGPASPPLPAAATAALPSPAGSSAIAPPPAPLRTRRDRINRARELLASDQLSLSEVAAEVGVHASTLFRWRQAGKV